MRCSHHDHVADNQRRGVESYVAALWINLLVEVLLQVDHAIITAPSARDPAMMAKLDAVAGRALRGR